MVTHCPDLDDLIWKIRQTELRTKNSSAQFSSNESFLLPISEKYLSPNIPKGSRALLTCHFKGAKICIFAQPTRLTFLTAAVDQTTPSKQISSSAAETESSFLIYELSKFSSLLLKGNPNLLELFIAAEERSPLLSDLQCSGAWMHLQANYSQYITEKVKKKKTLIGTISSLIFVVSNDRYSPKVVSSILGGMKHKMKMQRKSAPKEKEAESIVCVSDSPLLLRKVWQIVFAGSGSEIPPTDIEIAEQIGSASADRLARVSTVADATALKECVKNVRLALFDTK